MFEANDDSSLCREPDTVRRANEMNDSVVRGRGYLSQFLLRLYRWPIRALTTLESILWPIRPHFSHF